MSIFRPTLLAASLAVTLTASAAWAETFTLPVQVSPEAPETSSQQKVASHLRAKSETLSSLKKRAEALTRFEAATKGEAADLAACQEAAPCIIDVIEAKALAREAYVVALREHEIEIDAIALQYQTLAEGAAAKSAEEREALVTLLKKTRHQLQAVKPDIQAALQGAGDDLSGLSPASYKKLSDFGLALYKTLTDADVLDSTVQALARQEAAFTNQAADLQHYAADMHAYGNQLDQSAYIMRGNVKKFEASYATNLILSDLNGVIGTISQEAFSVVEPLNMDVDAPESTVERSGYAGRGNDLSWLQGDMMAHLDGLMSRYLNENG